MSQCLRFCLLTPLVFLSLLGLGWCAPSRAESLPRWQDWIKRHPTYPQFPAQPAPSIPLPTLNSPLPDLSPLNSSAVEVRFLNFSGSRFYVAKVDLQNPNTQMTIGLPRGSDRANSTRISYGQESFSGFVSRLRAAVVINGTFFGLDRRLQVMGNMVSGGQFLKYVPWENYGTTLGISAGKRPEMITARIEGRPNWSQHWFSITAGPRLLRQGQTWLNPRSEGFTDGKVMGLARRAAIGYDPTGRFLFLATFVTPISLLQEAEIMQALGCSEAMNLDGGSSIGLAAQGRMLVSPGRGLTNVIAIYDPQYPAPTSLQNAWQRFNRGERQPQPEIL
jgi:Phosphodiester glycosidase